MKYRRSGGFSGVTLAVCLGFVIGVGYLIYDHWSRTPEPQLNLAQVQPASATPPSLAATVVPTAQPEQAQAPREITDGARFFAPTAGISTQVIQSYLNGQSWDISDLGEYAGHLQGTAWMNEPGNIVLAGHVERADGRKGIFASITDLKIGDPLILSQGVEERIYQVSQILTVEPDDLSTLYPMKTDRLTLVTCTDYDFLQDVYHQRLVVIADRIS
jgi:LPXTG-site transpeptidase (sortase) family protein